MFVTKSVSRFVHISVLLSPILGLRTHPAVAGSFLMNEGEGQAIVSTRMGDSVLAFDSSGFVAAAPRYRKIETSLYLEYGLTRDLTLIMSPALRDISLAPTPPATETIKAQGIGTLEGGARWRLANFDTTTVSFQALVRTPMKSDPALPVENRPQTQLRLGLGAPAELFGRDGFIDISTAWIKRAEAWPDELRFDLTLGFWQTPERLLLVQYYNSLFPGAHANGAVPRTHKIETSTVYKLGPDWSLQMGSFLSYGGLLTRRERGSVIAVWRRF